LVHHGGGCCWERVQDGSLGWWQTVSFHGSSMYVYGCSPREWVMSGRERGSNQVTRELSATGTHCVGTMPFGSFRGRPWTSVAVGELIHVCGRVWVERLEPKITLLTNVSEAVADLIVVTRGALSPRASVRGGVAAWGAASPRAYACIKVVVVLGPC
jgi:hypothetical protein